MRPALQMLCRTVQQWLALQDRSARQRSVQWRQRCLLPKELLGPKVLRPDCHEDVPG